MLDRGSTKSGKVKVGDTVSITSIGVPRDFTVVGIVTFGQEDSLGGSGYTGFTDADARTHLLGGDPGSTSITVRASEGVDPAELAAKVAAERARLEQEIARVDGKLSNEKFVAGAPAAVVDAERAKRERYVAELAALGEG